MKEFNSFREFYPFYLSEHANRMSRRLHFIGSCGVLALLVVAIVQRTRNQFLTGTAFPADQHIALGIGHLLNDVVDLLHHVALSDDLGKRRLTGQLPLEEHVFR